MGIKRLFTFLHKMNVVVNHKSLKDFMNEHFIKNNYTEYCKFGIDSSVYIKRYMQVHGVYYTLAILNQLLGFLMNNVIPVYIFDGKPPIDKQNVLQQRYIRRINNRKKLHKIEQKRDYNTNDNFMTNKFDDYEKEKLRIRKQLVTIHRKDVLNIIEMLNICNIPYIQSSVEADSTLGELYRQGYIDVVLSSDMDLLLKGCERVVSFTQGGHMYEYNLNHILNGLCLEYKEFVDMCILFGCETVPSFLDTYKNDMGNVIIDQEDIYMLIKKYGTIENVIFELYGKYEYVSKDLIDDYLDKCKYARYLYETRNYDLVDREFSMKISKEKDINLSTLYHYIDEKCISQKMIVEGEIYTPESNVPFMTRNGMLNMHLIHDIIYKLNYRISSGTYIM